MVNKFVSNNYLHGGISQKWVNGTPQLANGCWWTESNRETSVSIFYRSQ